jgi:hypothetical protein
VRSVAIGWRGNFGGAIHAYDPATGALKGQLTNPDGNPILIDGLWALRFGNRTFGTDGTLVFTAGIGGESHGLLGEIAPAGETPSLRVVGSTPGRPHHDSLPRYPRAM